VTSAGFAVWLCALAASGGLGMAAAQVGRPELAQETRALLMNELQLAESDLTALARGVVVRKTLDTDNPDEVIAVGAVRIGVPRAFLVEQVRDIVAFKQSDLVQQIGTFGTPPRPADLEDLSVPEDDVAAIRTCQPGDCDLKLTTGMLERLQRGVDWESPDARGRASDLFKQLLVERLVEYLSGGTDTLGTYIDKREADSMGDEMASLLADARSLGVYAPELLDYLEAFPRQRLQGSESFLYWSKEAYGLKPVISATHVTIYTKIAGTGGAVPMSFVASRGLYASHYFQGSLALTLAIEIENEPSPAMYLVYVNRSRVDALSGAFGGLRRWIASRRVRGGMKESLEGLKRRLETNYQNFGE
jgi:hypothetical protein